MVGLINDLLGLAIPILTVERQSVPVHYKQAICGLINDLLGLKLMVPCNVNKNPTRCNSMQIFIYCKVTLHVSGVTAPIIRSIKNCNSSYSTALQRGLIRPSWREVAVPVL